MSTPLTDGINALTTYANEVTGVSDTTLSDAVETLVTGYGQGGGSNVATLELLQTYKVLTSWENPTDGNAPAILTAMGYNFNTLRTNEAYLCVIKGNTASEVNYRGDMIYMAKPSSNNNGYIIRNNRSAIAVPANNYYFFVSEGAEIDVYKITYNLP